MHLTCAGIAEHDIMKYSIPKHCIVSQNLTLDGKQTQFLLTGVLVFWMDVTYKKREQLSPHQFCFKLYGDK